MDATPLQSAFGALDWTIVVAYLLATVAIGLFARRHVHDMADYVVAGRSLRSHIAVATMIGSELGLVTVMYSAQKGFTGGFAAFHIALVAGVVTLIVGLTGFIVVPLRRMGVMTIPEFYERRYRRGVRVLGGLLLAGAGILNMGMFLKAGSIFVTEVTGMSSAFELKIVMTVLLVLVLFYTTLGGMLSVVITDYVQFLLLSVGLIVTGGIALGTLGWERMVDTVVELRGEAGFDPLHEAGFGPTYVVWMIFTAGLVSCAIWQTAVMRACSAESTAVVKRLYVWSSVGFMGRFLLPYFLGIAALTYFAGAGEAGAAFVDPAADAETTLAAMPAFLGQILPTGLLGLVAAGMLAAFMSTHDSYLLCWASVLTQDVVAPLSGQRLGTKARLLLTRLFIFAIGAFLLVWSLWYPLGQDLWDYMAITGAVYFTGAFALLVPGIYWRRASSTGAYLALLAGCTSILGLSGVQQGLGLDPELELPLLGSFPLDSAHVGLFATTLAVVVMIAGSILAPDRPRGEEA